METETVKTVKHTPGPWIYQLTRVNEHDVQVFQIDQHDDAPTKDNGNQEICLADVYGDEANAEFIVRACNSHYELLNALKNLLPLAEDGYKHHSNGCHEEFLKEDRTSLYEAREAIRKATS